MTTNIAHLSFDDGAQINVVKNGDAYTYVCQQIDMRQHGVYLEYTDSGNDYRVFVPWHQIDRIYQEI